MSDTEPTSSGSMAYRTRIWLSLLAALAYLICAFVVAILNRDAATFHFAAVIALPMAATLSFVLVTLMPVIYGPIELQVLGVTFKGAFAPIVLWIICFVVIVGAIKLLW